MSSDATRRRRTRARKAEQVLFLRTYLKTYCKVTGKKWSDVREELDVTRSGWNDFRNTVDQLFRKGVIS